jgi:iron complex transport system ATP-binding protein
MALNIAHIQFGYHKKQTVLHDMSLAAEQGELVSLVGPNGCGKTTFIKCINRILNARGGSAELDGIDLFSISRSTLAKYTAYVPQMIEWAMTGTVLDMVIMGRKPYINWRLTGEDIDIALNILKKLGMESLANELFSDLSGGQKQKVLIARALAQDTRVYLFDEPTSFLDIKNQVEIMNLARDMVKNDGRIVIMAAHDLNMAMRYSDKVLLMYRGTGVAYGTPGEVLTPENIRRVYEIEVRILDEHFIVPV